MLQIRERKNEQFTVIAVRGIIDEDGGKELKELLNQYHLLNGDPKVVLDFERVSEVYYKGLRQLNQPVNRLSNLRDVWIYGVSEPVFNVFQKIDCFTRIRFAKNVEDVKIDRVLLRDTNHTKH